MSFNWSTQHPNIQLVIPKNVKDIITFYTGYNIAKWVNNEYALRQYEKLKESVILANEKGYEDGVKIPDSFWLYPFFTKQFKPIQHRTYIDIQLPKPDYADLINVNMMPFILSEKGSLPLNLQKYWEYIENCREFSLATLDDKVAYLTIQESFVKKGETQRRPGLHIESPVGSSILGQRSGSRWWGGGYEGGIFLASNVPESFEIWKCSVDNKLVGKFGGVGILNNFEDLIPIKKLRNEKHQIYILNDHVPHEGLPMKEDGFRQFFRLVIGKVSVWYIDHSTPNPLCSVGNDTKVIHGNKFEM